MLGRSSVIKAKMGIICSMAAFGTLGVFVRNIPLASREVALYRAVIAVSALFLWQMCTGKRILLQDIKKELPLLFLSGAAMSINWILLFEAYRYTTVAMATLSYSFAPVIVTLASTLVFGEKLTLKQVFCFVMSTMGLVLVMGVVGGGGNNDLFGILLGLGAALFYGTVILLNKGIRNVSGLNRTFLQFIAAILVMTPYVLLTGGFHLDSLGLGGAANLLVVGLFHTGVCYCIYFSSIRHLTGQEISILSYIDPLVAVLVSVALLREGVSPMQAAGGFMILGFTVLNEWNPGTKAHPG